MSNVFIFNQGAHCKEFQLQISIFICFWPYEIINDVSFSPVFSFKSVDSFSQLITIECNYKACLCSSLHIHLIQFFITPASNYVQTALLALSLYCESAGCFEESKKGFAKQANGQTKCA
jgi:hypothetical protein